MSLRLKVCFPQGDPLMLGDQGKLIGGLEMGRQLIVLVIFCLFVRLFQAIKQMYVLVLGLDVLGNPFGLITGLKDGAIDFFYEPYQVWRAIRSH